MTWWQYVQRTAEGVAQKRIAEMAGVDQSTVSRWKKGQPAEAKNVIAFARSAGRPVLEALVAARVIKPNEAGERPSAQSSLDAWSEGELLAELQHRVLEREIFLAEMGDGGDEYAALVEIGRTADLDRFVAFRGTDDEVIDLADEILKDVPDEAIARVRARREAREARLKGGDDSDPGTGEVQKNGEDLTRDMLDLAADHQERDPETAIDPEAFGQKYAGEENQDVNQDD